MTAAGNVADAAKDEARAVAGEAKDQMKSVMDQARAEARQGVSVQQDHAVGTLRSIRDELAEMADGVEQPGMAAHLARQASQQVGSTASWLGSKEPMGLLDDVKRFARRRPAMFIGLALGAGVVAGRLTRGMIDGGGDSDHERGRSDRPAFRQDGGAESRHRAPAEMPRGEAMSATPLAEGDVLEPGADEPLGTVAGTDLRDDPARNGVIP